MRYGALGQRDENEPEIVKGLRGMGAHVWQLHEPADLLVAYRGVWTLLEVKPPGAKPRKDQREQQRRRYICPAPIHVVQNIDEALARVTGDE